ncbi:hypothetical protein R3P38DRAFT_3078375 [Favolaschia claudopus]|uniref:Uncharacterized protein n=1 Tax=Favolaschia claudopus TaxID=2862362 RepID=A0AAV9ZVB0_9AGAR
MFGITTVLTSLLFSLTMVSAAPTTESLNLRATTNLGPNGIGPIAPACKSQCTPLTPVFANASALDLTVTCRSDVADAFNACISCELGILGFDRTAINSSVSKLKAACASQK